MVTVEYLTRARRKPSWLGGTRRFIGSGGRKVEARWIDGGGGTGNSTAAPLGRHGTSDLVTVPWLSQPKGAEGRWSNPHQEHDAK
jgi:hypothetical protein